MKFRNKILLAIWGVVLGLLLVTIVIINYWVRGNVEARTAEELQSHHSTIRELELLRSNEIAKSAEVIAETPRLKAVAELGDFNTMRQFAEELYRTVPSDLFVVSDTADRPIAFLVRGQPMTETYSSTMPLTDSASAAILPFRGDVYRYATAPIHIGTDHLGSIAIGMRLHERDIAALKAMTNSEAVLFIDSTIVNSTLQNDEWEIATWLQANWRSLKDSHSNALQQSAVHMISAHDETYEAIFCQLTGSATLGKSRIISTAGLLLLKPIQKEIQETVTPVMKTFAALSAIVLLVTAGLGFLISKSITRPIGELVRGTAEVSRGNYDHHIAVGGSEEIAFLGRKFEEMSLSLKDKISQLAERNSELERTLRQLRETQDELVKSERLAVTGKLTAQLSHEINNPIHNIQSCLQTILKRTSASATDRELLEVAYEEVERMARLTRQLLQLYRTSMVQEPGVPLCLNDVIEDVLGSFATPLSEGHIEVKRALAGSLPMVSGSVDKFKQVFINLFLNAKDAMPRGGVLSVSTVRRDGRVIATVADTGVGIPPEHVDRVFEAFFTTKTSVAGVGLGLAVTYGIVKQYEGMITVTSKQGEGTTFALNFPAIEQTAAT